MNSFYRTSSFFTLSLALAACGAGTTAPRPPTTYLPPTVVEPPSAPTAAEFRTAEFNRAGDGWSPYSVVGAEYAYEAGYTGKGVTIAFIDFNFNLSSTDLNYHPGSVGANPDFQALYDAQFVNDVSTNPHAHAVASVAAGTKDGKGIHGVAFDATVLAVDFFSGVNETLEVNNGVTWHVSNPFTYVTGLGAKIVNTSLGYDEEALEDPGNTTTTDGSGNEVAITDKYTIATSVYVLGEQAMLVVSAGNDGDPDPMLSVLRSMQLAADNNLLEGPGAIMVVGGVDSSIVGNEAYACDGVLACPNVFDRAGNKTITNAVGKILNVKDFYITAPGNELIFPWIFDGEEGMAVGGGTSFAAPIVSGAAAIVMQKWPHLTPYEVANVLFTTAQDVGAPGTDEVYGRGLLDIRAALSPVGQSSIAVSGTSMAMAPMAANMFMGPSFGDARPLGLDGSMALSDVMVMDSLERDFYFDMSPAIFDQSKFTTSLTDVMEQDRRFEGTSFNIGPGVMGVYVRNNLMSDGVYDAQNQHFKDTNKRSEMAAASFSGDYENVSWKLGTGLGLRAGLKGVDDREVNTATLISSEESRGYFSNAGSFASASYDLNDGISLAFGLEIAENKGVRVNGANNLREDAKRYTSAVQINKNGLGFDLMMRAGALVEKDAVLGSRSSGGFRLVNKSFTGFIGAGARIEVGVNSSFNFVVNAGMTDVEASTSSLFKGANNFITTSWSIGFTKREVFKDGDSLKLSFYQPLRVENAKITIDKAIGLNYDSRQPIYETRTYGLAPSGRELALEASYRILEGAWSMQASLMYRHNAGHRINIHSGGGMMWLRRHF